MNRTTKELWAKQDQHEGDRHRLFSSLGNTLDATKVLYPGSYVDIAPSFVFDSVTYLDIDHRARKFFADVDGVREIVATHDGPPEPSITFVHADYTDDLGLPNAHFDLLVSLYAGFVSEHCTRHLRVGGTLLVNPSHGDVAMASIDPRYALSGVITVGNGEYSVDADDLDNHLIPKKPQVVTADTVRQAGRGVAYTMSPFAYLFTRVS